MFSMALDINGNAYAGVFIQNPDNRRRVLNQDKINSVASVAEVSTASSDPQKIEERNHEVEEKVAAGSYAENSHTYERAKAYFDGIRAAAQKSGRAGAYVDTSVQDQRDLASKLLSFEAYA